MKIGSGIVIGVALLAAAVGSTQAGSQLQGGSSNGSSLQGVDTNGSNLQGLSPQGLSPNGVNMQGANPNGIKRQGQRDHGADPSRPEPRSTGVRIPAVHVVGGRLFTGAPPARARGR